MLTAAYTLAFFGFLRCGELTVPSWKQFNPRRHPTRADIHLSENHLTYHLKFSKTDQLATGMQICIGTTGNKLCPVRAMHQYLRHHKAPQGPLFQFLSWHPLMARTFRRRVRSSLRDLGYNSSRYNTHSFCIGAATTVAAAGLPPETIKALGRWKSSCYQSYIRPTHPMPKAAAEMARAP